MPCGEDKILVGMSRRVHQSTLVHEKGTVESKLIVRISFKDGMGVEGSSEGSYSERRI